MAQTQHQKQEASKKIRFWRAVPRLLLALYFLALLVYGLFWVSPEVVKNVGIRGLYLPFMGVVFGFWFSLLWWLRGSAFKALVWTTGLVAFLILRIVGLGHFLNTGLLIGLLVSLEYYWRAEDNFGPEA